MANAHYRRYRRETFEFVKTMVIKLELNAEAINRHLAEIGYSIPSDPRKWKYYKHLAGEYHESDEMMIVRSTDTLEEIEFTKKSLERHRNTYRDYQFGTRFYNELVERFPEQESLILGILNPIDIDYAVNARDGEILYYDKTLVEDQEYSLMTKIQEWIDSFLLRWSVDDYRLTDELYPAAKTAILFANLPLEIMNIRQANAGTIESHSYHIREHLASHMGLDAYINELGLEQLLYLYRNVRYLIRSPGHHRIFHELVDNLVTKSRLPMATYEVHHNTLEMLESDHLLPQANTLRIHLNEQRTDDQADQRSLGELLTRQQDVLRANHDEINDNLDQIHRDIRNSRFSMLPSKVIESSVIDTSGSRAYLLEETILNHWLYLAEQGLYASNISVIDPVDNRTITITTYEAFYAYIYAYNKGQGVELENLPTIYVNYVRKLPRPSREEIASVVDPEYVTEQEIDAIYDSISPDITREIISTDGFLQFCEGLNIIQNAQRNFYQSAENPNKRAMLEAAVAKQYKQIRIDPPDFVDYRAFLGSIDLYVDEMNEIEARSLADELFEESTGLRIAASSSVNRRQRNVLAIMERLSSYSVQYLRQINDETLRQLENVTPRVEEKQWWSYEFRYHNANGIRPISKSHISYEEHDWIKRKNIHLTDIRTNLLRHKTSIDPTTRMVVTDANDAHFNMSIGSLRPDFLTPHIKDGDSGLTELK